MIGHTGDVVARRSLDFYQALALRLAAARALDTGTAAPSAAPIRDMAGFL